MTYDEFNDAMYALYEGEGGPMPGDAPVVIHQDAPWLPHRQVTGVFFDGETLVITHDGKP